MVQSAIVVPRGQWHFRMEFDPRNPYPSAIDWNALEDWEMQNLNNAVCSNDGGATSARFHESTNGGSNIIRSGQALWFRPMPRVQ